MRNQSTVCVFADRIYLIATITTTATITITTATDKPPISVSRISGISNDHFGKYSFFGIFDWCIVLCTR